MHASTLRNMLAMSDGKAMLDIKGFSIPVSLKHVTYSSTDSKEPVVEFECESILEEHCSKSEEYKRYASEDVRTIGDLYRKRKIVIKDVIFNDPATIVFWADGTKTVVKCQNGEPFDAEKGLAMAFVKKMMDNKGNYFNQIKKWTEKYDLKEEAAKRQAVNDILEELYKRLTTPPTKTKDDTNA